jgi:hypothetical protein
MSDALRAADADREATAAALRRAHEEGRLDTLELEERLTRCYAAKTVAELDRLVADLPVARTRVRRARPRPPLFVVPFAFTALALVVVTHGHAFFVFPLLFFLFMRFGRGWGHGWGGRGRLTATRR